MIEFDKGPSQPVAKIFSQVPDYTPYKDFFWFDWGPVFYRGRLDRSAKILCVASDPGPNERIAGRALVGNAGQRLQGFLTKAGITRSYVCLNGFSYALFPGNLGDGLKIVNNPDLLTWRNKLFKAVTGPKLKAVIAFGVVAQKAVAAWDSKPSGVTVYETYHPSYQGSISKFLTDWNRVLMAIRATVSKDPDGDNTLPQYGTVFKDSDYAPIPKRDLPFGLPSFMGDHSVKSSVTRPKPDDRHTLIWKAPKS